LQRYREGEVYYWPSRKDRKTGARPLRLRLIRIRAKHRRHDVWLLTNVLDRKRLLHALAGRMYHWRWQNEICQANYISSVSCSRSSCSGYDSSNGVAGLGPMDRATQESTRRIHMSNTSAPRADPRRCQRSCAGRRYQRSVGGNWIACSVR